MEKSINILNSNASLPNEVCADVICSFINSPHHSAVQETNFFHVSTLIWEEYFLYISDTVLCKITIGVWFGEFFPVCYTERNSLGVTIVLPVLEQHLLPK